jgi:DNA-binding XRE family transcriptional regulator
MKTILPYGAINHIGYFLKMEKMKRSGRNKLKDIEMELAEYCAISINGIRRIKRGLCYPSIETAFRIASFFNVRLKDLFELKNK